MNDHTSKLESRDSKLGTTDAKLRQLTIEVGGPKLDEIELVVEAGPELLEEPPTRDPEPAEQPQATIENRHSSTTLPLLLEVGCEEIPARFLREAERALGERVQAALREARLLEEAGLGVLVETPDTELHIEHSSLPGADLGVTTFSTPRRLVVHVPRVLQYQPDKVEEILGPPVKVAIDTQGNYTRAAASFAQKNSARPEDLTRTITPKGEYLSLTKTTPGRPAHEVLPELLPEAVLRLSFPKSMYWTEKSAARFVRPIRWIVALLGEGEQARVLDFELLGLKAGNLTYGHRAKSSAPLAVSGLKDYRQKLLEASVEIDYTIRKERILKDSQATLRRANGKIVENDWLADWLANSTEWPRAMLGEFDQRFLHLPREILITVMRDHQRYFAVESVAAVSDRRPSSRAPKPSGNGSETGPSLEAGQTNESLADTVNKLAPNFVAILNMDSDAKGLIRKGHQRVLTARFRDAEFFWISDQRVPLRDRRPLLDRVTYQERLGSYGDKINRMRQVAVSICETLERQQRLQPAQTQQVLEAVELCKCDLTTQMVQEFTELQGVVGGLYAKSQGLPEEISTAIYDHYLPAGAEGNSPRTLIGAVVSLTDKLDAVVGGFVAGLEPTGSRDPFAVRRAGNGIIKVLLEFNLPISLWAIVQHSTSTFSQDAPRLEAIRAFLGERIGFYLESVESNRHDTVRAVMSNFSGDVVDALRRAQAVEKIRDTDDYVALAAAAKRTRNILRKSASEEEYLTGSLNPELFQDEPEQELYRQYESVFAGGQDEGAEAGGYETILTKTARLRPYIDKFFDKVLVMHSDPNIRKNRLRLLHLLETQVFSRVADLSEIEGHVDAST